MSATWIETRDVPVDQLTKFPGNAKRGDVKAIRESIRRHGQYRAIVVRKDGDTLTVLAGNHTFDAVLAEDHEAIRCEIITCSDDEARRINLADNRTAELGTYDDDDLLTLLKGLDGDYEGTGWTADEFDKIVAQTAVEDPGEAEIDDMPIVWGVIVECDNETQQVRLLEELDAEGFRVRALM